MEDTMGRVGSMVERASQEGADLVLFPEAVLTGLVNCDIPENDMRLAVPIPGKETDRIAGFARQYRIIVAVGLLERDNGSIYDCAVLFSAQGLMLMKYRRMQSQWHGKSADPLVYREGTCIERAETEGMSFSFLICGDLFDDGIVSLAKREGPDYVLLPMSRNFEDGSYDQERWDAQEKGAYAHQVKKLGIMTFITNSLEDPMPSGGSFGGAFIFDRNGVEVKSHPLGRSGILFAEV